MRIKKNSFSTNKQSEPILYTVSWFDSKTVVATWTNRLQNVSQIASYALSSQWQPLLHQETPDGWLLYPGHPLLNHYGYVVMVKLQTVRQYTNFLDSNRVRFFRNWKKFISNRFFKLVLLYEGKIIFRKVAICLGAEYIRTFLWCIILL